MFGPKTRAEAEKATYGLGRQRFDPRYCAASVHDGGRQVTFHQCNKKPGFGPDGIFCRLHDPEAVKKRDEERNKRWKAEQERERPKWYARDMLKIIRKIAEGHNDPRSLCADFLKKYDKEG